MYAISYMNTYESNMNSCFIIYNSCAISGKKDCWPKHEKCVINGTKKFKKVMKQFDERWPYELK